jgi:hypothetical protein
MTKQAAHTRPGTFLISLDLELFWGMFDKTSLDAYGARLRGVHEVVPEMLALFSEYDIHATWAAVGMMTTSSKKELEALLLPKEQWPTYANASISTYVHLTEGGVGESEHDDPYHFGGSLIGLITKTKNQELGSHTFSHYYALEDGQTTEQFDSDLKAQERAFARYNVTPRSLVFPRNQVTKAYVEHAARSGVQCYRATEEHPFYRARSEASQTSLVLRACRFLDRYLPLSGFRSYAYAVLAQSGVPYGVPASRQLSPFMPALRFLEPLKLLRIKAGMTKAARRGELYHLWWHPHNFGTYQKENIAGLRTLLEHFNGLKQKYGMRSCTMEELAQELNGLVSSQSEMH